MIFPLLLSACKNRSGGITANTDSSKSVNTEEVSGYSLNTELMNTTETDDVNDSSSCIETEPVETTSQLLTDEEMESIMAITKTAINDDIWYKGEWSFYKDYENQQFEVEFFVNESFEDIFILLEKETKLEIYRNQSMVRGKWIYQQFNKLYYGFQSGKSKEKD